MRLPLFLFVLTLPLLLAQPAMALTDDETSIDTPSVTSSTHKDWQTICVQREEKPACEVTQTMQLEKDGQAIFAMRITLFKQAENTVMEIALPLGLDLQAGIAFEVDENGEVNLPFSTCFAEGCAAVVTVDAGFINQLRQGAAMKVAYRPFRQSQALVLSSSLSGFTGAIGVLGD
jgi:invasion protein IalB